MTIEAMWMQVPTYPARLDRQVLAAMSGNREGVFSMASFLPTPSAVNMTCSLFIGWAAVKGDDQVNQGTYFIQSDAAEVATVVAPGSDQRVSVIGLQIRDSNATGPAGDDCIVSVVNGPTAPSNPAMPTIPDSFLPLIRFTVPSTATNLAACSPVDLRGDISPIPTAMIVPWAGNHLATLPAGYALCDGQDLNIFTEIGLFMSLGYTYGGSGSNFKVPDLRGRSIFGYDNMGTAAGAANRLTANNTRGAVGGAQTHTLTVAEMPGHDHGGATVSAGSHTHSVTGSAASGGAHSHAAGTLSAASGGGHSHTTDGAVGFIVSDSGSGTSTWTTSAGTTFRTTANTGTGGAHTHSISGSTATSATHTHTVTGTAASDGAHTHAVTSQGNGAAHNNMPPYAAMAWMIKL